MKKENKQQRKKKTVLTPVKLRSDGNCETNQYSKPAPDIAGMKHRDCNYSKNRQKSKTAKKTKINQLVVEINWNLFATSR